jgi:predicted secreted Zn-dependent protease
LFPHRYDEMCFLINDVHDHLDDIFAEINEIAKSDSSRALAICKKMTSTKPEEQCGLIRTRAERNARKLIKELNAVTR